ncbi:MULTISPECIES: membrane protein [Klebsiella]|uniref:membrane protein n=1 Tax=Klebsiella TaxID=570 RepID=UPI0004A16109|nr:membrane protein [Klebsiella aerogenes]ELI7200043.1 hypothetical protein [Klebsiella aerogenes]ELY3902977.1 hypothetical protein [Klebsiella aerogenes]EMA4695261.1 hypothetical protein [Klebsiella aerogenes]KDF20117.1 hypothetical protein AF47_02549 [Klebsiella aerogenes MGH 61]KVI78401.1 hypothetical protein AWS47_05070 [Klebsiella aerogenes]
MKSIPRYGLIIGLLFLSGCAKQPEYNTRTALSTEVATRWGSDVHSTVKGVSAERVDSHPDEIVLINYSGQYQTGFDQRYSIRNSDLEYAVRDANFNSLPITRSYNNSTGKWQYAIAARVGTQYQLYVRNYSHSVDYEIVATVDGLDVLSGKAGSLNNNGYIVPAGGSLAIKGFRKNSRIEAAFEFSNVAQSYAAHSVQGDTRNVGVIGFAAFALRGKEQASLPPCASQAFQADGFAPAPCQK